MLKEFCAENFTKIPLAIANGANRIELCDNLAVGGTTPSYGVIRAAVLYGKKKNVKIMTMVRPRGGNFVYDDQEFEIMQSDLQMMKNLGVDGVVFGCLNSKNWLDESKIETLLSQTNNLEVTFHMAFDEIDVNRQFEAIDWLVKHHVTRILTHGGELQTSIEENYQNLQNLIDYASQRIIILPGGGINYRNLEAVAQNLKAQEFHGTDIVNV